MDLTFISPEHPLYPQEVDLRFQVLRAPLGGHREDVFFPFEDESLHLVALEQGQVQGCVLFHPETPASGRLFQMAVAPPHQGAGWGRRLVLHLEDALGRRGYREVTLHARAHVVPFYEKLGYACVGAPYEEVGLPHRNMVKTLTGPATGG